jgi:hypothetical protein
LQVEALYNFLKVCGLVKMNLAIFMPYAHMQELLGITQIPVLPSLHQLFLSFKEFLVCTQKENIIYIDNDDNTLVFINKELRV